MILSCAEVLLQRSFFLFSGIAEILNLLKISAKHLINLKMN